MKLLVNGQLIDYTDEGSGRTLLMLHGWGTNGATFDQLAGHFVKNYRVIRFDFPGFGQSPKPADDWAVCEYAQITHDFLEKMKIDELYAVVAHSFGGRIVIKGVGLGLLRPEKIVLIDSAGVKPRQSIGKNSFRLLAKVGKRATSLLGLKKLQPLLRGQLYSVAGTTDYLQAHQMQQIFLNVINEDLLPEVTKLMQPTLLIWGEDDIETPLADARLILDSLSDGRLVAIPKAGHFVYTDAYNAVVNALDGFLR
ncbi:MAG: alpha/beta hydrolase [Candidatus Saccharibacteria bacterium]